MSGGRGQLPFDFAPEPDYRAEAFIVADCNRAAHAWIERWPDWPGPGLALHGPAGSGKTHLASIWQMRSHAVAIDPAMLDPAAVPDLLGDAPAALIDWADDPRQNGTGEQALLHVHNLLAEQGGHLMLISRTPPARWRIHLADLRSRLAALLAVRIDPPDDELLRALLAKHFADRQLEIAPDAIAYLLPRMERSFDAARKLVGALDRLALAGGRRVTIALAREVMAEGGADLADLP